MDVDALDLSPVLSPVLSLDLAIAALAVAVATVLAAVPFLLPEEPQRYHGTVERLVRRDSVAPHQSHTVRRLVPFGIVPHGRGVLGNVDEAR